MEKIPTNKPEKKEGKLGKTLRKVVLAGMLSAGSLHAEAQSETFDTTSIDTKPPVEMPVAERGFNRDKKNSEIVVESQDDARYIESLQRERLYQAGEELLVLMKDERYFTFDEYGEPFKKDYENWPEEIKIKHMSLLNLFYNAPAHLRPENIAFDSSCNTCIQAWEHRNKFNTLLDTPLGRELYDTPIEIPYVAPPKDHVVVLSSKYQPMYKNPTESYQTHNKRKFMGYKTKDTQTRKDVYYYTDEEADNIESVRRLNPFVVHRVSEIEDKLYRRSMDDLENGEDRARAKLEAALEKSEYESFISELGLDIKRFVYQTSNEKKFNITCDAHRYVDPQSISYDETKVLVVEYTKTDGGVLRLDLSQEEDRKMYNKISQGYFVFL